MRPGPAKRSVVLFTSSSKRMNQKVRQAASVAVESLETRRLLSYSHVTLEASGSEMLGQAMVTSGDYVLTNASPLAGGPPAGLFKADDTFATTFGSPGTDQGFAGGLAFIGKPDPTDANNDGEYGYVAVSTVGNTGVRVNIYNLENPAAPLNVVLTAPAGASFNAPLYSWNEFLFVHTIDGNGLQALTAYRIDNTIDAAGPTNPINLNPKGQLLADGVEQAQMGFVSAVNEDILVTQVHFGTQIEVQKFTLGVDDSQNLTAAYSGEYLPASGAFGQALALDGSDLFVNGSTIDEDPVVHHFVITDDTAATIDTQSDIYSLPGSGFFGSSIAAAGGRLAITSTDASTTAGDFTGAVFVYDYDHDLDNAQDAEPIVITNPNPNVGIAFGATAGALSEGRFAISDPSASGFAGAVHVFSPATQQPQITTATLDGGNLIVTGTGAGEVIDILSAGTAGVDVYVAVQHLGTFAPTGRIIVNGGGGNDAITVSTDVALNADLFGGAGNDTLVAGGGMDFLSGGEGSDHLTSRNANDILLGNAGDDVLLGGNGRDLLIGGDGADQLAGNNGDDILVAGYTNHTRADLDAILAVWNNGQSRDVRIASLEASYFASGNVINDGEIDSLFGGTGQDYFLVDSVGEAMDATKQEA